MDGFSTFNVEKILGIKRTCLQEWLNRGFIKPSIQKAFGKGSKALFSREDIYKIKLFEVLLTTGFKRDKAKDIIHTMESFWKIDYERIKTGEKKGTDKCLWNNYLIISDCSSSKDLKFQYSTMLVGLSIDPKSFQITEFESEYKKKYHNNEDLKYLLFIHIFINLKQLKLNVDKEIE